MNSRTDLAVESYETNEKTKLSGVVVTQNDNVTVVEVLNSSGALQIGKPPGKYVTLNTGTIGLDGDIYNAQLQKFSTVLRSLLPKNNKSVFVAGIGNESITADSLGPKTSDYVLATRHIISDLKKSFPEGSFLSVSTVATGVLGETGIETAEIIKGIVNQIHPSCVIAVDALAASSADRLGNTVQFSDSGISPGSGVGNHRNEISSKTIGVPVVSIGIPTVVSTAVLGGTENGAFVTPREIDKITLYGAKFIGMGLNLTFHKGLAREEILRLVG